jgi:oligopeptide transport system substrate-binding protein
LSAVLMLGIAASCERQDRAHPPPSPATPVVALHRGLGADPATLDPQLADDNASRTIAADIFEGLTTEDADGNIIPGAAQSWTLQDSGRTYVFRLRADLRWSDGEPLTAGHFADGLRAVTAPGSAAPGAALLAAVESVDALDARTLRIRLSRPVPYLPALLSLPVASPVHPHAASLDPRPGNGAFRLVRYVPGERVELERNPRYRDAAAVAIDRVSHYTVADLTTELNLFRAGDLDLTSEVPNAQFDLIRNELPGQLRLSPYLSVYSYVANMQRLPDRRVRLALAMAVDRDRVTRLVTGAGERPAYGWIPEGIALYTPARFEWQGLPYPQAVAGARTLWRGARAAGSAPARLRLCTDASANHHRTAVAMADLWRTSLGIETQIIELEWNVYLDRRKHPGDCDLVRLGWSADFVDPEAFAVVFESGSVQNTLGYRSAAYDSLIARSRLEADAGRRMALLNLAEQQLLEDVPVIPVFFRVSKRLVQPYVVGYAANPLGHVASRNLRVEPH